LIRRAGIERLPYTLKVFRKIGVFPLCDHYYEPLFNPKMSKRSLSEDRDLVGLDLNISEQLELLTEFQFNNELLEFPLNQRSDREFYYNNHFFESGDAEFLYNMIRRFKPRRIVEIGSGQSTLMAANAIEANRRDAPEYSCKHICIEPYEAEWLESLNVEVIRTPVEHVDNALFAELEADDILFIDSSHMIRPQGDVLYEFLEILPRLNSGVFVHVHDIFTPRDYPAEWIFESVRFWNEQYLLEAFLSFNTEYEVIGALNFLKHHYPQQLVGVCPVLGTQMDFREPGSFWLRRV
jgi:predicted O-methyltransferase YrrM